MPRKPVVLGELQFSSREEANAFFSGILNSNAIDEELSGNEYDAVFCLLSNHPRAEDKMRSGVQALYVGRGAHANNRCFHLRRIDGTTEDFSIGKCLKGDYKPFHKFCVAGRKAVENEIRKFKREYFETNAKRDGTVRCHDTGAALIYEDAHVDHRAPMTFSAIAHTFIKSRKLDLTAVTYITEGKYGNEFSDPQLAKDFAEWHRDTAILRVVQGRGNLQRSSTGRITMTKKDQKLAEET